MQGLHRAPGGHRARRSSPTASSVGRASPPTRSPTPSAGTGLADHLAGPGGAVLRDLRRRPQPPAAQADRRPVPLQDLRRRHAEASRSATRQADEAGGDRAVDARAAVPAAGGGRRLPPGRLRGGPGQRVREGHPAGLRGRRRARLGRLHGGPAGHPRRPAQPVDRGGHAAALHRARTTAVMARFTRRGAQEHRHPHLSRRRPRLGAPRRRALQQPAAGDVQHQRGLLPHPAGQRAGPDPVYESIGKHSRRRRRRRRADVLRRRDQPGEPAGREPGGGRATQLVRAANFIPKERLGSTDDCGFSPFTIDEKPNHGSPDYAREVAFQKITNRVEGTRMAAEKLGVS